MEKHKKVIFLYIFLLFSVICTQSGCLNGMDQHFNFRGDKITTLPKEYDVYVDNFYIDPDFKRLNIRRVLFLPLHNKTTQLNVSERVTPVFVNEFQKKGLFEIVYENNIKSNLFNYDNNNIDRKHFIELGKTYNVDAVMYGTILQYKVFQPFILGVSMNMVRTFDGSVIWSAEDIKDASLKETEVLAKHYFYKFISETHPLTEWKIVFMSMDRYIKFVSYLFVDTFDQRKKLKNHNKKEYFR